MYSGYESQIVSSMFIGFFSMFMFFILCMMIVGGTKSRRYRKLLVDLYVAGKIKQLAKKDGIDLADEMKDFRSVVKKWKMESQPLDNTIEQELQEKIEEDSKDIKGLDLK